MISEKCIATACAASGSDVNDWNDVGMDGKSSISAGKIEKDVIMYDRNNLIPINGHTFSHSFDFVWIFRCTHNAEQMHK